MLLRNKLLLTILLTFFSLNAVSSTDEQFVDMNLSLYADERSDYLAITLKNKNQWHTYWKNPGYAGLPIKFQFNQGTSQINLDALEWPVPQKYMEQEEMLTYGYEGQYTFFYRIKKEAFSQETTLHGTWLVCKDICIPGERIQSFTIKSNKLITSNSFHVSDSYLKESFQSLPQKSSKPENMEFYFLKVPGENSILLQYEITNVLESSVNPHSNVLFPFLATPLDFKMEELFYDQKSQTLYGQIKMQWDGEYEDPQWPLPEDGVFKKAIPITLLMPQDPVAKTFTINLNSFQTTGYETSQKILESLEALNTTSAQTKKMSTEVTGSLFYFFFFAFLGGLILNLMPCVLPVISLKLFGLIKHSNESKKNILKHNLSYTLGVLASFMLLALSIFLLKKSGEEIGWGFQMQSPYFVFGMLIVLFILTLNMLGLFEFRTPGGRTLGNLKTKDGFWNDFLAGVFATVLATPCSAPFLGTALTFAFTTSSLNLFIIFFSVGLGLASPFILTGFFPSLISFLPKPGMWMEKLKYFLGLTLLITFAWLFDVFNSLIAVDVFGLYFSLFFVFLFFAFFFRAKISKNILYGIIIIILPMLILINIIKQNGFDAPIKIASNYQSEWKDWSKESMLKTQTAVFVDFTAKWCLTCKVNKRLVLDTKEFKSFAKENNLHLMRADWTQRDAPITLFLKEHNIIGVPAYFVKTKTGKVISLGETISLEEIKEALNQ